MASWKPRKRGAIYCSPACGAKCLKADYDRCVREADALAKLLGPGWVPRIWENLGWHYEVGKDVATVWPNLRHSSRRGGGWTIMSYTASLSILPEWQTGKTATVALGRVLREAEVSARRLIRALKAVK